MPEDEGVKIDVTTKPASTPTSRPIIVNTNAGPDPTVTPAPPPKPTIPMPPAEMPSLDTLQPPVVSPSAPAQSPPMFGELQGKVDAHPLFSGTKEPKPKNRKWLKHWLAPLVVLFIAASIMYLLIDAGIVRGASHLPFHIFKQTPVASTPVITPVTPKVATNPYADWKTYLGDPVKNAPTITGEGDSTGYTFMYPSDWAFYPIGTSVISSNGTKSSLSFQELVPNHGSASTPGLSFKSLSSTDTAQLYEEKAIADQGSVSGPKWQKYATFTTANGYNAYTGKLELDSGVTDYETAISNGKSIVVFDYSSDTGIKMSDYQLVFDSVTIP